MNLSCLTHNCIAFRSVVSFTFCHLFGVGLYRLSSASKLPPMFIFAMIYFYGLKNYYFNTKVYKVVKNTEGSVLICFHNSKFSQLNFSHIVYTPLTSAHSGQFCLTHYGLQYCYWRGKSSISLYLLSWSFSCPEW